MIAELKGTVSEGFRQSVDDAQNASSFLFPGAAEFSRHLLQAQKELLMGFTSMVDAQIASLDKWGKHAAEAPKGGAAHHTPEKIRVDVSQPRETEGSPKKASSKA